MPFSPTVESSSPGLIHFVLLLWTKVELIEIDCSRIDLREANVLVVLVLLLAEVPLFNSFSYFLRS